MICMLVTLYTNCYVNSSKMLYTYAILFKPCVLAFAFVLNFIFNMLQVDDDDDAMK
ncbi:hypothetical protein HanXRQr2_Chr12g0548491 [Helianthus annuus]|uniref:Transmembrane protein n=1 Tax=Helianthus annuus TaxID=4232 RepID=A0A9K3MWR8_HELAN|nr:hypothetical protein HanXRQr2_Chr12g0548491 [Helianthus annuus]KAJ0863266.1 hypothetical protein HanPSC8_Chr12g0527981 [Helianthus annuus]